jgi:DNA-directed RNA polymerase specialized sigma24 family protein
MSRDRVGTLPKSTIDFDRLYQRLVLHACYFMKIFRDDADSKLIDGVGKSPSDFAMDTLLLFLEEGTPCTGDEAAITTCLKRVMEHDIVDARRSATAKTTKKVLPGAGRQGDDGVVQQGLDDFEDPPGFELSMLGDELKATLYALLEHEDPELYDLVYAIFEEDALTPRAIAEILNTTSEDVQNRKKRLRTFLGKNDVIRIPVSKSR